MGAICRSTSASVAPDFTASTASEPSTTFGTCYVSFAIGNVSGLSTGRHSPLSPRDLLVVKSTSTLSVPPHARERSITDDALPVPRRTEPPTSVPRSHIHVTTAIGTVQPENAAELVRHGPPAVFAVCGRSYNSAAYEHRVSQSPADWSSPFSSLLIVVERQVPQRGILLWTGTPEEKYFESDVEPCAIGHHLCHRYVLFCDPYNVRCLLMNGLSQNGVYQQSLGHQYPAYHPAS